MESKNKHRSCEYCVKKLRRRFCKGVSNKDNPSKNATNTLWVLSLNDEGLDFNQLKSANKDEMRVFRSLIAPAITRFKKQHKVLNENTSEVNQKPSVDSNLTTNDGSIKQLKVDIQQILNKFGMSFATETENNVFAYKQPSIKLFFLGPYTSLIVKIGRQRFHYFIDPPSSLPRWFYQDHNRNVSVRNTTYINIPTDVKYEFYEKLYNLLTFFFSFPV